MEKQNGLDLKEDKGSLSLDEMEIRRSLQEEFWKIAKMHDSLLFQKLRDRWIKEGDANTRYFHNMVNWIRKVNAIKGLSIQGEWVEDPSLVKGKIKDFFEENFKDRSWTSLTLGGVHFNIVSAADNASLTAYFDLDEIENAMWDCEGDRSPDSDGFNFRFLNHFWEEMKVDIARILHDFHRNGVWPKGRGGELLLSHLNSKCG